VDEVQIDVDQVGLAVLALDHEVVVPDLLGQGAGVIGDAGCIGTAHVFVLLRRGLCPRIQARTNSATREA